MVTPEAKAAAEADAARIAAEAAGAGNGTPNNAEVAKLTDALATSQAVVAERDVQLETANKSLAEVQVANQKFADDAAGLVNTGQQLKDAQLALEESRKTSVELTTKLEEANAAHTTLQGSVMTRRRQDLVSKYGLPEERVADLDDAGLKTLEDTLPHITPSKPNPSTNGAITGTGYGLDSGTGQVDKSKKSDFENAQALIEGLKTPK